MNDAVMHRMAGFVGAIQCQRSALNNQLHLHGRDAETQGELDVWINGPDLPLPDALRDAELFELPGEPTRWQLQAPGVDLLLSARSVQVHWPIAAPFNAAVAPPAARLRQRALWATLLTVLRLPGAASLLRWFRSR